MNGSWDNDQPSMPERIREGGRTALRQAGTGWAAVVAVALVAVVLIAALVWAATRGSGADAQAGADPTAGPPPPATAPPAGSGLPEPGAYRVSAGGLDGCLGVATLAATDRAVIARLACEGDDTLLEVREVDGDTVVVGFRREDLVGDYCLQPDGPAPGSDEAGTDALYYFAPYWCEHGKPAQLLTLVPTGTNDEYQLRTHADQCLDVFGGSEFAGGTIVGTNVCDAGSPSQRIRFLPD